LRRWRKRLNAEIARIIAGQHEPRIAIDAIVAEMTGFSRSNLRYMRLLLRLA
jgi:hypothetical protein